MKLCTPTLRTPRLLLHPFSQSHRSAIFALQSDPVALKYWDSPPWADPARSAQFIARCQEMADEGHGIRVAVELAREGTFVGWCTLTRWNHDFRSASLGYCFTVNSWGNGYATEAVRSLLTWAFCDQGLNRVQAEVDTRNEGSARVLAKLGFTLEGTLREDCIVNGERSDSWVYGLLRREWDLVGAS